MAWPPASLPTNRTNATPQTNTHPADHNAVNAAVNDTVAHVQAIDNGTSRAGAAELAYKIRSVDTPNDIELHWDSTVPALYYRIDGGEWFPITVGL